LPVYENNSGKNEKTATRHEAVLCVCMHCSCDRQSHQNYRIAISPPYLTVYAFRSWSLSQGALTNQVSACLSINLE
jgi:hypothetical protein